LIAHCRETARIKRRMYREETYWGRPVPGFGDRGARILFLGLAPGAHGANRTGRLFTGDRSGEWLYAALHRAGLADRPQSISRDDGLQLSEAYITNVCRCAPPGNRPSPEEVENCRPFLDREFAGLRRLRVIVALGSIAWGAALRRAKGLAPESFPRPRPRFGHGAEALLTLRAGRPPLTLLGCYHPSQQNTQTGRLTRPMLDRVLRRARHVADQR
jgi:uracil-DNA glycosylase family 4